MDKNPFPKFIDGKKRLIKKDTDVEIEPEAQTEDYLEGESFFSKKFLPIFYLIAGFIFLCLFLRLFYLQIIWGEKYKKQAEENRLRIRMEEAPRGIIYDRNKTALVTNAPSFFVKIYPADLPRNKKEREDLYQKLISILNIPLVELEKVEEKINSFDPIILKENLTQEEAIIIESKISNLPAIEVAKKPKRVYKQPEIGLAHILGYTGKMSEDDIQKHPDYFKLSSIGKTGLENTYDNYLRGEEGKKRVEVDAQGKMVRILANSPPSSGNNLITSLDLPLQEKMALLLSDAVNKSRGKGGVAIAADPKTGFILGFVSFPSYDNNLFAGGVKKENYEKLLKGPQKPMFNRAIAGLYPPGSTIKPVVAAAALSEGIITPKTSIDDPGEITIVNKYNPQIVYRFPDWKPGGHGRVDVYKALEWSCDVFFYALGGGFNQIKGLGEKKLKEWFAKFGLGKKTGIDLPGEENGFIPSAEWKQRVKKEGWYQGDNYHLAIGQGDLLVTPIQLLNYTIYFANGGKFYKPKIVSEIQNDNGETIKRFEPEVMAKDLISKNDLDVVREGMKRVAVSGTARSLSELPFLAAGKTGTAQNPHGNPHAWFISFAPYEDPKIATVVLIENAGEGSAWAVPVTKEILRYWIIERGGGKNE